MTHLHGFLHENGRLCSLGFACHLHKRQLCVAPAISWSCAQLNRECARADYFHWILLDITNAEEFSYPDERPKQGRRWDKDLVEGNNMLFVELKYLLSLSIPVLVWDALSNQGQSQKRESERGEGGGWKERERCVFPPGHFRGKHTQIHQSKRVDSASMYNMIMRPSQRGRRRGCLLAVSKSSPDAVVPCPDPLKAHA